MRPGCRTVLAAVSICAMLAGCGGAGSSAPGPTSGGAPTAAPAPSPSPTSTVSNTYPSAPHQANGPVDFQAFGWSKDYQAGTVEQIASDKFSFRWDGQASYNVNIAKVGTGRLRYFFGRTANGNVFSLEKSDATIIPVGISFDASDPLLAQPKEVSWHYPASGTSNPPTEFSGSLIIGHQTTPFGIPSSGSRHYRYDREGIGKS